MWSPPTGVDFARLTVHGRPAGRTDEAYEREADAVAERVVTARDPDRPVPPASRPAVRATTAHRLPPPAAGVLRSPGAPLDRRTRAFMEPRFGMDFSAVRVHAGDAAARSADSLNAYAYTVGNHIVLGGGATSPTTPEARRLLAHELTHVVRQAPAGGPPTVTPRVQRQAKPGSVRDQPGTIVYFSGDTEAFIAELERRGFIAHDEWDAWGWIGDASTSASPAGPGPTIGITGCSRRITSVTRRATSSATGSSRGCGTGPPDRLSPPPGTAGGENGGEGGRAQAVRQQGPGRQEAGRRPSRTAEL